MIQKLQRKVSFYLTAALVFSLVLGVSGASAHDMWLNVSAPEKGTVLLDIGYGHDFPTPEPIPEDRTHLFNPPQLVTPEGALDSTQKAENYAFQINKELSKGSYIASLRYRPTFWANGPGGWTQQNRIERPDATYAQEAIMFAKAILNVDASQDAGFISKPLGDRLEIVPLENPALLKVGNPFPIQVLFDGKPVKTAEVYAVVEGFSDKEHKAFYGRTDLEGKISIIPLKDGYWFAKVSHKSPHEDPSRADELVLVATLTFSVNP